MRLLCPCRDTTFCWPPIRNQACLDIVFILLSYDYFVIFVEQLVQRPLILDPQSKWVVFCISLWNIRVVEFIFEVGQLIALFGPGI